MVCVLPPQQWVKATPEIQVTYLSLLWSAASESKRCSLGMGRTWVCQQRGLQGRISWEPCRLQAARLFSVQLSLREWQHSQAMCSGDNRGREKNREGKGNGPVSLCSLCCPACVPGEEKGRRMCLTGKAAEGFPCCNQLSPGEKSRSFFDGQAISLTEVSVPQLVLGPVARRWIRPSPSSFFPGILTAHPPAWPSRPASPTQ